MDDCFKLSKREKLHIFPISDAHIGSESFNQEYFKYALQNFDGIKGPKIIYLLGDILEAASLSVGNSSFKQKISLNEQLNKAQKLLMPYKKYIRGITGGNHEARLKKDYDLDVTQVLAELLKIDYTPYIFDELCINDETFTVFGTHGKGSSQYYHTSLSKVEREVRSYTADLYLYGHLHRTGTWSNTYKTKTGLKRQYYLLTGHYLRYDGSYAMDMLMPELPESFSKIKIGHNLDVDISHYHRDIIYKQK